MIEDKARAPLSTAWAGSNERSSRRERALKYLARESVVMVGQARNDGSRAHRGAYSMRAASRGVGGGGAAARGSFRLGVFPGTIGDQGEEGAREAAASIVFCGEEATCPGCARGGGEFEFSLSVLIRINCSGVNESKLDSVLDEREQNREATSPFSRVFRELQLK